jgi:hypothetical protein
LSSAALRLVRLAVGLLACMATAAAAGPSGVFRDPRPVRIVGYGGDVMEPFLSRDGRVMFFNNRNDPKIDTDLFWAERIDGLDFRFRGPLAGANSRDLDAVASMDANGAFYFVSSRDYAATGALIHRGRFKDGVVDDVTVVQGLASKARPGFNFDAEISADGERTPRASPSPTGGAGASSRIRVRTNCSARSTAPAWSMRRPPAPMGWSSSSPARRRS